jgi:hypothetical protein
MKNELIKEICKTLMDKECYGLNLNDIEQFLEYIEDTTVLGDILADLKS